MSESPEDSWKEGAFSFRLGLLLQGGVAAGGAAGQDGTPSRGSGPVPAASSAAPDTPSAGC